MLSRSSLQADAQPFKSITQGSEPSLPDWRTQSPRLTPSPFQHSNVPTQTLKESTCPPRGAPYSSPECQDMIRGMVIDALREIILQDKANETSDDTRVPGNRLSCPESERFAQHSWETDPDDRRFAHYTGPGEKFLSSSCHDSFPPSSPHSSTSYSGINSHPLGFPDFPTSPTSSSPSVGSSDVGVGMGRYFRHSDVDVPVDGLFPPSPTTPYYGPNSDARCANPSLKYAPTSQPNDLRCPPNPRTLPQSWLPSTSQDEEMLRRVEVLGVTSDYGPSSPSMLPMVSRHGSNHSTSNGLDSMSHTSPFDYQGSRDALPLPTTDYHDMPRSRHFFPMEAVLDTRLNSHSPSSSHDSTTSPEIQSRFSKRYLGKHTAKNASHDYLEDHENCALWLQNLPPDITYAELFDSIRGIGRVWAVFINRPDARHDTSAAKVTFFAPEAAARYLIHVQSSNLKIRDFVVMAEYNRIKSPHQLGEGPQASRILIISGQSWFVNTESLTKYFQSKFKFQTDRVIERFREGTMAVIEYRFGSFRCQAQVGKTALERERPYGFESAVFGQDPCEVVMTSVPSYDTAAERVSRKGL